MITKTNQNISDKYIEQWKSIKFMSIIGKRHFLSLFRQQEEPWSTVQTVSEKQNNDTDPLPELLKTIMSAVFPILTKIRKSKILHIWPDLKIINMWDDLFYHLC